MGSREEHLIRGTAAEAQARRHLCDVGDHGMYYLWPLVEGYIAAREFCDAILARDLGVHPSVLDERYRRSAYTKLRTQKNIDNVFIAYENIVALYQCARAQDRPIPQRDVQALLNQRLHELRTEALQP